jgi:tyrosyl-tRNA synthetase
MYGKLMSISDEMMWRYYELLTDVQVADIEKIKRESHPMQAKKDLAQRIVKDFHSAEAAAQAAEDWAKQFQKGGVPEDIQKVHIKYQEVAPMGLEEIGSNKPGGLAGIRHPGDICRVRLDKLLYRAGLADSITEGSRKIRQKAVKINGEVTVGPWLQIPIPRELTVRIGKMVRQISID